MNPCKFCGLLAAPDLEQALPNLVLQGANVVVALNRKPIAPGHLTLILKAHHDRTSQAKDVDFAGLGDLVGKLSRALEEIHGPTRVALIGDGKRSAHLHFHLIPEPPNAPLDHGPIVSDLNLPTRPATLSDSETAAAVHRLREILSA